MTEAKRMVSLVWALAWMPLLLVTLTCGADGEERGAQRSGLPQTPGQALRGGWELIGFSVDRTTPIVPNQGGGIHHVFGEREDVYVLRKGNDFISCNLYQNTETTSGKWGNFERGCARIR